MLSFFTSDLIVLEIEEFAPSIFASDHQQFNCWRTMCYANSLRFQNNLHAQWEEVIWCVLHVHIKRSDTKLQGKVYYAHGRNVHHKIMLQDKSCNFDLQIQCITSGYPNTETRVENMTSSGVFLTKFEVFG